MEMMCVVGVDPGPVTGIVLLYLDQHTSDPRAENATIVRVEAIQATAQTVPSVLTGLWYPPMAIGMERFVVGPRASRSSTPEAGKITRAVENSVWNWAADHGLLPTLRSASEVKPWATDRRLTLTGIYDRTAGMRHARDGGRHALFEARMNHGIADPLSARSVRK